MKQWRQLYNNATKLHILLQDYGYGTVRWHGAPAYSSAFTNTVPATEGWPGWADLGGWGKGVYSPTDAFPSSTNLTQHRVTVWPRLMAFSYHCTAHSPTVCCLDRDKKHYHYAKLPLKPAETVTSSFVWYCKTCIFHMPFISQISRHRCLRENNRSQILLKS